MLLDRVMCVVTSILAQCSTYLSVQKHDVASVLQPFPTQELRDMGYEKKRHQAGRAFETAALCSTNYSFGRAADFKCDSGKSLSSHTRCMFT